ncbi:MAG: glycosyltransferase family 9 protein [bacterium]|nr:glycosyltransferase family 9 protein [bacterium]
MGIGDQFQTVVYYEDTGDIREILPNQYIKSRKSLNSLLGLPESRGIKFFYVPGYFPLMKENWKVKLGSNTRAPRLISQDGKDGVLLLSQKEAEYIFQHYKEICMVFEGGLGDYIDQADVVIACKKKYPEKKLLVEMDGSRKAALNLMDGFEMAASGTSATVGHNTKPTIEFSKINKMCGDYGAGGKIGVYSLIAGLDKTAERSKIKIPKNDQANARGIIQENIGKEYKTIIALHTMSGNCNTKGIPPAGVPDMLSSLLEDQDLYFLHIGGAGEETVKHEQIISLQGKLNWPEVFAAISLCDGCVCIDSAILHIAQHLGLPTVSLWGPTDCINILGNDSGVGAVTSTNNCAGCNQYECQQKDCMQHFNKKELNRKLKKLIKE